MPYKINHKKNDKAKANQSHLLFDVLSELKLLQSFISTEQLNDCQLVEEDGETSKCVSIAPDLEYVGISQEICSNDTPLFADNATDWESLNTSLESCSVETSAALSDSEDLDLIGSLFRSQGRVWVKDAKVISEYEQQIPQSQIADKSTAPRGRATQQPRYTRKTH